MTKKPFGSIDAPNKGSYIPGSAGKGGDPGMTIHPADDASQAAGATDGLSGGADAGNSGAGIAGSDVEVGGTRRSEPRPHG